MSSKDPSKFRTCKSCGHDNPDNAKKCNGCGGDLFVGIFDKENFHKRWGCPDCGRVNMEANSKCLCGYKVPGCFLTTACVEYAGLPDDCEALTLMRKLRDNYVAKLPDATELISEYYEFSPKIVAAINAMPKVEAARHYEHMLEQVGDISKLVQNENYSEAKNSYFKMYDELRRLL